MNTLRLGNLIRRTHLLRPSNSFPGLPKFRFFSDVTDGESVVYHHARLCKKPLSTPFAWRLSNSVKLVGFVDRPIRVLNTGPDKFGVWTFLRVKDPRDRNRSFRISLRMWDEMGRVCVGHLNPGDHVFVSGRLESYIKSSSNENEDLDLHYQVKVKELNYVMAPPSHVVDSQISRESTSETEEEFNNNRIRLWKDLFANPYDWRDQRKGKKNPKQPDFKHKKSSEALWHGSDEPVWVAGQLELFDQRKAEDSCNDDDEIYLWQVFFMNPDDWWDNRRDKTYPKQPDFKHKSTKEALWLGSDLPDWVTRQLELLDQRSAEKSNCYNEELTRRSSFSEWF